MEGIIQEAVSSLISTGIILKKVVMVFSQIMPTQHKLSIAIHNHATVSIMLSVFKTVYHMNSIFLPFLGKKIMVQ